MFEKLLFKKVELWSCLLCVFLLILGAWAFGAVVKSTASGGTQFGRLGQVAMKFADYPLAGARLLFGVGKTTSDFFSEVPPGMKINDYKIDSQPLSQNYAIPSYEKNGEKIVKLVTTDPLTGKVNRSWEVNSEVKAISYFDNSLIVMGKRGYQDSTEKLSKIDQQGRLVWEREITSHHSVFVDADGYIYTPTINLDYAGFPSKLLRSTLSYRDDGFAILSPQGGLVDKRSITEILVENELIYLITGVGALEWDPIHLNSVKPAPKTTKYYEKGDLLLSLRHLSMVMLFRPSTGKIIWYQMGPWTNQHDADFLEDGNISVFGNDNVDSFVNRTAVDSPLSYGYNNIYVHDFSTGQTSKVYENLMSEIGINTVTGGSHKIFPNGDLMAHFPNMGLYLLHRKKENQSLYFGLISGSRLDNLSGHNLGSE